MKKFLSALLVLCIVFSLVACGGSGEKSGGTTDGGTSGGTDGGSSSAKDTLTIAVTSDSGTLDPLYNVGWDLLNALRMIYEPLWEYQGDGTQRFILAKDFTAETPTKWLIHLRDDVTFSNGNPFTADDVLFSLWRANNRIGVQAFISELDYDNCKAIDDYTVELNFTEASISFTATFASIYMFDKESFDDATSSTVTIGTGPYSLDAYVVNSHMNLVARDGYWGTAPNIPNLQFRVMGEEAQRVNAIQTGEVDIASIPFQDVKYVQTLDNLNVNLFTGNTSASLYMNISSTRKLFSELDATARLAIAYAIDREAIRDIAYDGFAEISRYPLSTGAVDDYDALYDMGIYGEPDYGYNPAKAKELAESSGLVNYEIKLINNGSAVNALISELVQTNLKDIGVKVNIFSLDAGSWLTVMFDETQYDMALDFNFGETVAAGYRAWVRMAAGGSYTKEPWEGSDVVLPILETIMSQTDQKILDDYYMTITKAHVNAMLWYELVDVLVPTAYDKTLKGYAPMRSGNIIYTDLSW
ncbi:MAG: ABC transporter substrate-binding protein [Oscillospiraceae bacterium]|jgi:peptide/nickel transport system substrate-binding protein|nr:ABC transporter substrate-binding protein [Oscillospiraceae bacterium]